MYYDSENFKRMWCPPAEGYSSESIAHKSIGIQSTAFISHSFLSRSEIYYFNVKNDGFAYLWEIRKSLIICAFHECSTGRWSMQYCSIHMTDYVPTSSSTSEELSNQTNFQMIPNCEFHIKLFLWVVAKFNQTKSKNSIHNQILLRENVVFRGGARGCDFLFFRLAWQWLKRNRPTSSSRVLKGSKKNFDSLQTVSIVGVKRKLIHSTLFNFIRIFLCSSFDHLPATVAAADTHWCGSYLPVCT